MVGIVIVSHSAALADGVIALARQMASADLVLEPAGGFTEPGSLGTDPERIRAAVARAMSPDGVLVLMDLGSALISAEFALELLGETDAPVLLSDAPLVEGAIAAAVAASGGAPLAEVAAEARGALAMKTAQLSPEQSPQPSSPLTEPELAGALTAELPLGNEVGLHARPAARVVQAVRAFDADVRVAKRGGGVAGVSARSLTNLIALGARQGDTLLVSASGPQAADALDALRELAADGFGDGLTSPAAQRGAPPTVPPPAQSDAAPDAPRDGVPGVTSAASRAPDPLPPDAPPAGSVLAGVAAASGVWFGHVHQLASGAALSAPSERPVGTVEQERALVREALDAARTAIAADRERLAARTGARQAAIFDAHLVLLDDEALLDPINTSLAGGASAEQAVYDAACRLAATYRAFEDPLLAARAADVMDVGQRLLAALSVDGAGAADVAEGEGSVVVAEELTPSQSARLDPRRVKAIATARGSATAHAAIIARALGIPAVVGIGPRVLLLEEGAALLVDGDAGEVTVAPSPTVVSGAGDRARTQREARAAALAHAGEPAVLATGERIRVLANIGGVSDARQAVEFGAEGVGMLRTEFLYLERPDLPDEDEQFATLLEIADALDGRPLTVRTLDAGADKPLPALSMDPEPNPFLGVRGIRVGLARPELLRAQLRAVLRVGMQRPVKLMTPMVATLAELLAVRRLLDEQHSALGVGTPLELGITLEVPAAAVLADRLAPHLDFFSLGTNDLTQYTMAADRGNAGVAPLLSSPQPAVLRLIRQVVDAAASAGERRPWVGVCGEMAGDPASAVLLVGLGVTELSMAPRLIPELKALLRSISLEAASAAARAALDADDAGRARALALAVMGRGQDR